MQKLSTRLLDRELRFDGVSIIHPDLLAEAFLRGLQPADVRLTEHSRDSELFNQAADEELQLVGPEPVRLSFEWQLPQKYLELDIYQAVGQAYEAKLPELAARYSPEQYDEALERVSVELAEFERRGMVNFLRTIIYILDVFRQDEVVWGVGRGSSCASYVLYLLGLHAVDCVWYNVPMSEFFHD